MVEMYVVPFEEVEAAVVAAGEVMVATEDLPYTAKMYYATRPDDSLG